MSGRKVRTRLIFSNNGLDKILKKVGEESAETIIAAKNDDDARLTAEVADLVYHLLVLLVARGVSLDEVARGISETKKGQVKLSKSELNELLEFAVDARARRGRHHAAILSQAAGDEHEV